MKTLGKVTARDLLGITNLVDGEIYYCAVAELAAMTSICFTCSGFNKDFKSNMAAEMNLRKNPIIWIKESGIFCRGKQSWPMFTAFSSGRAETELTEDHAEELLLILGQSLAMLEAVKKDKKKEVLGNPEEDFRFPVRQKKASNWQIAYLTPDAVAAPKALSWTKKDQEKLAEKEIGNISWT